MRSEKKSIEFEVFFDENNEPCCAKNFDNMEICKFYRTKKFGCLEVCALEPSILLKRRGKDSLGTLIPQSDCILHLDRKESK